MRLAAVGLVALVVASGVYGAVSVFLHDEHRQSWRELREMDPPLAEWFYEASRNERSEAGWSGLFFGLGVFGLVLAREQPPLDRSRRSHRRWGATLGFRGAAMATLLLLLLDDGESALIRALRGASPGVALALLAAVPRRPKPIAPDESRG